MKATPYLGDEPYIFISYPHRDSERVFPIVEALIEKGFRVWYDEGIVPGREWDYDIATHLNNCSFVIAFMSEAYLNSENCKDELNYARDLNKPRLLVYLDNVELPAGMAMRLNRLQAIMWFNYTDKEKALDKVISANQIEICRKVVETPVVKETGAVSDAAAGQTAAASKKKWLIPAICGAAAVVVIVLCALLLHKDPAPAVAETAPAPAATEAIATPEPTPTPEVITDVEITLRAPENMGVKAFEQGVSIVRDRLDILCGDYDYKLEVNSDTMNITIPDKAFKGIEVPNLLRCYISRPCNLWFFDRNDSNKRMALPDGSVKSVVLEHGSIDGVETEETEYDYLRVTFTKSFSEELADYENVKIAQDMENSSWFYFYGVMSEDGTEYLLYDTDWQKGNILPLIIYNMTHEHPSDGFYYGYEIIAYWEDPEDVEVPGKNQCMPDKLPEDTFTVYYTTSKSDARKGELEDTREAILSRLDILGCPYAFGSGVEENSLVVRLPQERYITWVTNSIFSSSASKNFIIVSGLNSVSMYFSDYELLEEDGRTGIRYEVSSYNLDQIQSLEKLLQCGEPVRVYYGYGYENALENAWVEHDENSVTIWMDCEQQWVMNAINAILDFPSAVSYSRNVYSTQGAAEELYAPYSEEYAEVEAAILQAFPDITVERNGLEIRIHLGLEKDDELIRNTLQTAADLYEVTELEKSPFNDLFIVGCTEDDSINERCRVIVRKNISSKEEEPGTISARGIFFNGVMTGKKDEIIATAKTIPMYNQLTVDYNDWSFIY